MYIYSRGISDQIPFHLIKSIFLAYHFIIQTSSHSTPLSLYHNEGHYHHLSRHHGPYILHPGQRKGLDNAHLQRRR